MFAKPSPEAYFLACCGFCIFHSFSVQSSDAVTSNSSVGWKASDRTQSKWLTVITNKITNHNKTPRNASTIESSHLLREYLGLHTLAFAAYRIERVLSCS